MESVPFALSIHGFVNSVGADAGFASIIGLAILVLLYFAQARETSTLRERLDEASTRADGLEQRMAMLQRSQAAPAQPPGGAPGTAAGAVRLRAQAAQAAPASAVASGGPGRGGEKPAPAVGLPFAPAGVGAPALAAATKLIPAGVAPAAGPALAQGGAGGGAELAAAGLAGAAAGAGGGAAGAGGGGAGGGAGAGLAERPSGGPDDTMLVAPRPVTAAANGHSQTIPPVRPPDFSSPPPSAAPPVGARPPASGGGPRRPITPSRPPASRDRAFARRVIPALIGLGVIAVIVVAVIVMTSGSSTTKTVIHPSRTTRSKAHGKGKTAATVVPAKVTVSFLNGTDVTNLAHDVGVKLTGVGYKEGQVATAANQTHTTTIVGYLPGQRAAAVAVAKALGLSTRNVQPADAEAKGVACPSLSPSTSCSSDVIVTIGTDLASAAGTTTT